MRRIPSPNSPFLSFWFGIAIAGVFSSLLGQGLGLVLARREFATHLREMTAATRENSLSSDIVSYAQLAYRMLDSAKQADHLGVEICDANRQLAVAPPLANAQDRCVARRDTLAGLDSETSLAQWDPPLQLRAHARFRPLSAQPIAISLGMFMLFGIVLLVADRRSRERYQVQAIFAQIMESLCTGSSESLEPAARQLPGWTRDGAEAIVSSIFELNERMRSLTSEAEEAASDAAVGRMATQVAHDIRSPLSALQTVERDLFDLPEAKRELLRIAIQRIREIADALLRKNPTHTGEAISREPISTLILPIIAEKQAEFSESSGFKVGIEADLEAVSGLYVEVQPSEFRRVMSNLMNNAAEASPHGGQVLVKARPSGGAVEIQVIDEGNGIPEELLHKLGTRGATFGKMGGSGLGLYHAKKSAESWSGALSIRSKLGQGTIVTILLPLAVAP